MQVAVSNSGSCTLLAGIMKEAPARSGGCFVRKLRIANFFYFPCGFRVKIRVILLFLHLIRMPISGTHRGA